MENKEQKTAFIAIVGRPNVGKSSILNRLIGQKVAIVSRKPQTTRNRITGILTRNETQIVFTDTPGLHKPKSRLGDYMVKAVNQSVSGVDACLLVAEAGEKISPADVELMARFSAMEIPAILAINKVDTVADKTVLLAQIEAYHEKFDFTAIVPVSARDGSGMDALCEELMKLCMPGIHMFPDDCVTDQADSIYTSEIIREKLLRSLDKEIPHGIAVSVEQLAERENGIADISAVIYCEKDSHKGIIIGKGGEMLKKIGSSAREELERFFDCKVNLQLWVKVKEDWRNRDSLLKSFGYDGKMLDE